MSRLDNILPDVSKMTDDELTEWVKQVRKDRRITKVGAKPKMKKKSAKSKDELREMLKHMTPEQRKGLFSGN